MGPATEPEGPATEVPAERPEILVRHVIGASPQAVFEAFADADALARWWGPDGFSTTTERFEFRPGGRWDLVMHGPEGAEFQNSLVFREIVEPERIAYDNRPTEAHPGGFENTFTLEARDSGTLVTMRMVLPEMTERDGLVEHGILEASRQTLARLAAHVEEGEQP